MVYLKWNPVFDKSFAHLLQGKQNLKFSQKVIDLTTLMRPFHRQAKIRAVAEPLSRAMSIVDLVF